MKHVHKFLARLFSVIFNNPITQFTQSIPITNDINREDSALRHSRTFLYRMLARVLFPRSKFALVLVGALVASTFSVSVANATPTITRTLPAGSTLYSIPCDYHAANGQLASVNTATGFMTTIGSGTTDAHAISWNDGTGCAGGATYNPVTHTAFWFNWMMASETPTVQLFSVNTVTGNSTYIGELAPGDPFTNALNFKGLATDSSGKMFGLWQGASDGHFYVGEVNQSTASITAIHQLDATYDTYFNNEGIYNFAFNPIDSKFYTAGQSYRDNVLDRFTRLYTVNVTTGAVTSDVASGDSNASYNGMAIDSNGVLWGANTPLFSATVGGWSTPGDLQWIEFTTPYYTEALFIVPARVDTSAAERAAAAAAAAKAAADAAEAKREAEIKTARADISNKLASAQALSIDSFKQADIAGVTADNFAAVQAEILALPVQSRSDITQVLKVARKFEVVGMIGTEQVVTLPITAFVEVGLIPSDSKYKTSLIAAVKRAAATDRDSFVEIQAVINAEVAKIQARQDRLTTIISRIRSLLTK